jgi:uncharacterized protein
MLLHEQLCKPKAGVSTRLSMQGSWFQLIFAGLLFCGIVFQLGLCPNIAVVNQALAQSVAAESQPKSQQMNKIPPRPEGLHIYVNDLAGLLAPEDTATLQERLQALDESGIAQVSVLILPDTEQDLSQFAPDIMNAWGIQHHKKQDGLLVLVNAHRVRDKLSGNRIFVGTGLALEQILPDPLVGRILDEKALPAFEQGNFSGGVTQATLTLVKILAGDRQLRASYARPAPHVDIFTILFILFFIIMIFGRANRFRGGFIGGGLGGGFFPGGFGGGDGGGFGGGFGGGGDSSGGGGAGR